MTRQTESPAGAKSQAVDDEDRILGGLDPAPIDGSPRSAAEEEASRDPAPDGEEPLPSFSEQVAEQLGGVRGLVESSIPVTVFVLLNFLGTRTKWWSLRTALIISVVAALALAVFRLSRREPVRHAVNGVFGVALGALIAWNSGEARDFYLPGIILTAGNTVAMLASVAVRRPLVGWIWAVTLDGGGTRWYRQERLLRAFGWLTALWALVYGLKVGVQYGLYQADQVDLLGVARLALGWPPYAFLILFTVWAVRRVTRVAVGETGDSAAAPAADLVVDSERAD